MKNIQHSLKYVLFAAAVLLASCTTFAPSYNEQAYTNATSLKAKSLAMIEKSGTPYSRNASDVETLLVEIDAAFEFSKGLPNNTQSAKQWDLMRAKNGGLFGQYVELWKSQGTVGSDARQFSKKGISDAYDQIICLEINKQNLTKC